MINGQIRTDVERKFVIDEIKRMISILSSINEIYIVVDRSDSVLFLSNDITEILLYINTTKKLNYDNIHEVKNYRLMYIYNFLQSFISPTNKYLSYVQKYRIYKYTNTLLLARKNEKIRFKIIF